MVGIHFIPSEFPSVFRCFNQCSPHYIEMGVLSERELVFIVNLMLNCVPSVMHPYTWSLCCYRLLHIDIMFKTHLEKSDCEDLDQYIRTACSVPLSICHLPTVLSSFHVLNEFLLFSLFIFQGCLLSFHPHPCH